METSNYFKTAFEKLLEYKTPKSVTEYILRQKIKCIIGNPPFITRKG